MAWAMRVSCSVVESVEPSPVVPQTTSASIPAASCASKRRSKVARSTAPSRKGVIESFGVQIFSTGYRDVISFVVMIIFLLVKPNGLLGKKKITKV